MIVIDRVQVLNRTTGLAEICDTQAAMNLLGNESEVSSHQFTYLHAWAAVGYQNSILRSNRCNDLNNDLERDDMNFDQESLSDDRTNDGTSDENFSAGSSDENPETSIDDGGTNDETDNNDIEHNGMNSDPESSPDDSTNDGPNTGSSDENFSPGSSDENPTAESNDEETSIDDGDTNDGTDSNDENPTSGSHEVSDCESEPENHEFESEFTEVKNRNGKKYTMYVDHEGQVHAISQHEVYRHRVANWDLEYKDPGCTDKEIAPRYKRKEAWKEQATLEQQCGLKEYSLVQFCMHITLKRIPPSGIKDDNTRAFLLNKRCPIHKSHYLHLNSKEKIPILAGVSRPCPPQGEKPKDARRRQRWQTRANRFARYVGALLFPWDRNCDCGVHD
jgi:hypothetical protein